MVYSLLTFNLVVVVIMCFNVVLDVQPLSESDLWLRVDPLPIEYQEVEFDPELFQPDFDCITFLFNSIFYNGQAD